MDRFDFSSPKEGSLREIAEDLASEVPQTRLLYVTPVSRTTKVTQRISPALQEKLEVRAFRNLLAVNKDKIGFFAVDEVNRS